MPVSVAEVHRHVVAAGLQLFLDVVNDLTVELIERALAVEMEVVLAYFHETLTRDASPAGYVF